MNEECKKQRVKWLDMVKGYAIVLVVTGHYFHPEWLSYLIWSFHMPLFAWISGYFYKDIGIIKRFKMSLVRYGLPYFICWFVISSVNFTLNRILVYIGGNAETSIFVLLKTYIHNLVYTDSGWYFISLVFGLLYFSLIFQIKNELLRSACIFLAWAGGMLIQKIKGTLHFAPFGMLLGLIFLLWLWMGEECKKRHLIEKLEHFKWPLYVSFTVWMMSYVIERAVRIPYNMDKIGIYGIDVLGACAGVFFNVLFIKYLSGKFHTHPGNMISCVGGGTAWIYAFHVTDTGCFGPFWERIQLYILKSEGLVTIVRIIFDIVMGLFVQFLYRRCLYQNNKECKR